MAGESRDDIDYTDAAATFGDRLTLARETLGVGQDELAARLGVTSAMLRDWEEDRAEPRTNRLHVLAATWRHAERLADLADERRGRASRPPPRAAGGVACRARGAARAAGAPGRAAGPARGVGRGAGPGGVLMPPFHLAFPVRDLEATRDSLRPPARLRDGAKRAELAGLRLLRPSVSAHVAGGAAPADGRVDGQAVPIPHFGVAPADGRVCGTRPSGCAVCGADFRSPAQVRLPRASAGEQGTGFLSDPSGNTRSSSRASATRPASSAERPRTRRERDRRSSGCGGCGCGAGGAARARWT